MSKSAAANSSQPGRNDLCPCGSGKKYKKCCARNQIGKQNNIDSFQIVQEGVALFQNGYINEARVKCDEAIALQPTSGDAYHLLGLIDCQQNNLEVAQIQLKKALMFPPVDVAVYTNLAQVQSKLGLRKEAVRTCKRATKADPGFAEAYNILGLLYRNDNDLSKSLENAKKAFDLSPDKIEYRLNFGLALQQTGDLEAADRQYKKILELQNNNISALINLGALNQLKKKWKEALTYYRLAEEINDQDPLLLTNIGITLMHLGDLSQAVVYCRRATESIPESVQHYLNLTLVLQKSGQADECALVHEKILEISPGKAESYAYLIQHYIDKGKLENAQILVNRVIEKPDLLGSALADAASFCATIHDWGLFKQLLSLIDPQTRKQNHWTEISDALLYLNYPDTPSLDDIYNRHCRWGLNVSRRVENQVFNSYSNSNDPGKRLKIGYLSPDFREHSVGFFIQFVVSSHSNDKFEIYCYSNNRTEDSVAKFIQQSCKQYIHVEDMTDEELAYQIHDDGIDILIDLAGHTAGTRLPVMALKPAPVQATYLGYPNTTGLDSVDYRITDAYADIPDGTRYIEQLAVLPECFLCFGKFDWEVDELDLPAKRNGFITFGSFNNVMKITPNVVSCWSKILAATSSSRLIIKSQGIDNSLTRKNIVSAFESNGIASKRIILKDACPDRKEHMALYQEIDIALDTFPYNGTTTTCEALWMGVPVVTLTGSAHVQRASYSILANLGLQELAADSDDSFVEIATTLASDIERLRNLRELIPVALRKSILCDPQRFTSQLEDVYRKMWARYIEGA